MSCFPVIARSVCDEAIHFVLYTGMDCFAALAMTFKPFGRSTIKRRRSAPLSAGHDPLVQSLIDDLDRAVDIGIGHAELM